MHALVKFTDYGESFQKGNLYMNTLDYFWKNGKYKQQDILEGIISTASIDAIEGMPDNFKNVQLVDYQFQAVGYAFCNVFCMSRVEMIILETLTNGYLCDIKTAPIKSFGKYAVIIDDEKEFLSRIKKAVDKLNYKFLCGKVDYHIPYFNGVPLDDKRPHIVLRTDPPFDINNILKIKDRRDAFDKAAQFRNQLEWRMCLYRGEKSTEPFTLNIGDIHDITHKVRTYEFERNEIYKLKYNRKIFDSNDLYYGNISRRELRDLFYKLGDYKAWLISVVG